MSDVFIAAVLAVSVALSWGLLVLCDRLTEGRG
jgi:hypothetical protein